MLKGSSILYSRTIVPCGDGVETPTQVTVTEENNGHAIWYTSHDITALLMFTRRGRDCAIYEGVEFSKLSDQALVRLISAEGLDLDRY